MNSLEISILLHYPGADLKSWSSLPRPKDSELKKQEPIKKVPQF
ncbi:hypothetical protein HMPREF1557_00632 [Streptococcus sobrinus W1703]|uniref:Uncharacterized protein n=1 Tax=Streptococcus sobrinus W1703 TaxID=1227275 RepID=U2JCH8_9STRE|nr:hypothetical protein HMPREF1557_00632 [Streptococcus sobrinus W1703]